MRRRPKIFHIVKFLLLGVAFLTVLGFGVRELWNCLIPDLFHGPVITFWQALGLCLLGKLLFGWHGSSHKFGSRGPEAWRQKFKERMQHMTPEEKEKMRERFKRCAGGRFSRWNDWHEEEKDDTQTKEETNI